MFQLHGRKLGQQETWFGTDVLGTRRGTQVIRKEQLAQSVDLTRLSSRKRRERRRLVSRNVVLRFDLAR